MSSYHIKNYDDHFEFGIDRDGSFQHTAKILGLSVEELENLITNKFVLDLGSGPALFAKRCYIKQAKDNNYKGPRKVESMNIRINDPSYRDYYRQPDGDIIFSKIDIGDESFTIPTLGTETITDEEVRTAVERAENDFSSLDWNDLIKLPPNIYDVIISNNGFPYYSGIDAEVIIKNNKWGKAKIIVTEKDLNVFSGIAHVLKPNGVAYLTLNHRLNLEKWDNTDSKDKQKLIDTLALQGCSLEVVENKSGNLMIIRKN